MIKCREVMDVMERIAPKRLAEDWDNPGLLVGSPDDEIRRILVCLDVREETAERAQAVQWMADAGLDERVRGERLTLEELARLSDVMAGGKDNV